MPGDDYSWDFFLAHASPDKGLAEQLYVLLEPHAKPFLDSRSIPLGAQWDDMLAEALKSSRISVFLITSQVDEAHYLKDEVAIAVERARADKNRRVVPAFVVEDPKVKPQVPYGLHRVQGLTVSSGELEVLADKLLALLASLKQQEEVAAARKEHTAVTQKRALENLTQGTTGKVRLEGLQEITQFFGLMRWCLLTVFILSIVGVVWCLLFPPPAIEQTRGLAAGGLGGLATFSFGGLMMIINKSLDIARELARGSHR